MWVRWPTSEQARRPIAGKPYAAGTAVGLLKCQAGLPEKRGSQGLHTFKASMPRGRHPPACPCRCRRRSLVFAAALARSAYAAAAGGTQPLAAVQADLGGRCCCLCCWHCLCCWLREVRRALPAGGRQGVQHAPMNSTASRWPAAARAAREGGCPPTSWRCLPHTAADTGTETYRPVRDGMHEPRRNVRAKWGA